jgi:hypothetical protein
VSEISPRHTEDARTAMVYNMGWTDTRWNFRYECVMLVTYIGELDNLPYGTGNSAKFDTHPGEIKINKPNLK